MTTIYIKIVGMTCDSCKNRIQRRLQKIEGVKLATVSLKKMTATVQYDESRLEPSFPIDPIIELGYHTSEQLIFDSEAELNKTKFEKLGDVLFIFLILILIYLGIKRLFGFDVLNAIPEINNTISLPLLFVIGLMTSVHCVGMCGVINISGSVLPFGSKKQRYLRPILYNLGRVVAYTVIGGLAGLIGKVLSPNAQMQGLIIGLASIYMLLLGLSMLGLIPKPSFHFKKKNPDIKLPRKRKSLSPFITGILNGFMPCGPLQAMQIYAISTASFLLGATSLFLFALGTVPLMLLFGLVMNHLKGQKLFKIQKFSAALVILLSITMFSRSLSYLGLNLSSGNGAYAISEMREGYQYVKIDLSSGDYQPIVVEAGTKVVFNVYVSEGTLNGCNNPLLISKYGIERRLVVGDNLIEFTPESEGVIPYTCWMRMIKSQIVVVEDITDTDQLPK